MTTPDIQQAREWARNNIDDFYEGESAYAVCEVIQSLPDQIVDGDKLRQIIDFQGTSISDDARKDLESLLTPPLPTLADLIEAGEDPQQYQWMQADHIEHGRVIITHPGSTYIYYMKTSGLSGGVSHSGADRITPLPDLPRLEWPGSTPDDVAYATGGALTTQDVVDECRAVRKERALPRPEDVPAGEAWLILRDGHEWVGTRDSRDGANWPWSIARLDGIKITSSKDLEITLVSRLVPEDKP